MTYVSIPHWTAEGVLPPVNFGPSSAADRSPYRVSLTDLVLRFSTSSERWEILDGFLLLEPRCNRNQGLFNPHTFVLSV